VLARWLQSDHWEVIDRARKRWKENVMKTLLLIVLALTALAGCVVVPAGPDYGYAYPGYPYHHGYYRHEYYWRQTP
jgi:hypothetical protein